MIRCDHADDERCGIDWCVHRKPHKGAWDEDGQHCDEEGVCDDTGLTVRCVPVEKEAP